ncbi:FAD-dependent oxidoreductase [Candidatus Saccharibacteria bacterium]|nr:FAD-dependent oxidoreductase [Candidatus Saccharibacteria bacterium]
MTLYFEEKTEIQPGVWTFEFRTDEPLTWQAGQYLHYTLKHPNPDDRAEDRYFTISSPPYEGKVQFTTRKASEQSSSFKQALFGLNKGDAIEAEPPSGKFVWREGDLEHVLVSGGIGITPFRSMLLQLDHEGKQINADLLYSNRDDHLIFGALLDELSAKHPDLRLHKYIGQEITKDDLAEYTKKPNAVFYLSGPKSMVESFVAQLLEMGVLDENILKDKFPGYSGLANA